MASFNPGPSFVSAPSPYESDVEAELEVDQLDSDSEIDELADPVKPPTSKNGTSRPGERIPGHSLLPAGRLENLIQADGGTGSLALSKEALYLISIASEEFIKRFVQAGHREANAHHRNQINYVDMATTTQQYQEFMFLGDTIPSPMSLMDALMLRGEKERELLEDNPALGPLSWPPAPMPHLEPAMPMEYESYKPPRKSRSTNGKEKANGSGSTGTKRTLKKSTTNGHPVPTMHENALVEDMDTADSPSGASQLLSEPSQSHRRSSRNVASSLSESTSIPPPTTNGQPLASSGSQTPYSREESMDSTSHQAAAHYPTEHSPPYQGEDEPTWPGPVQFTGPASGFLRGTNYVQSSQNPGRTIYSQIHPDT